MSETILAAFKQYDEDQSGSIDIGELQNLIEDLGGKPLDQEELDQALVMLDADKSGQIEQVWTEKHYDKLLKGTRMSLKSGG